MAEEHPGVLYFYSESVGLAANGVCLLLAALSNLLSALDEPPDEDGSRVLTGAAFIGIGGVVQLAGAVRAFRAFDHFGATAFGFFAIFWSVLGLELLLDQNIEVLHVALLMANISLWVVAPIVNAYYVILIGAILLVSVLEMSLRFGGTMSALTAVVELLTFVLALYGAVASVLHGLHQRQVLWGFEDAVLETVLWKRPPLHVDYTDGKHANPRPLAYYALTLGVAGLAMGEADISSSILVGWKLSCAVASFVAMFLFNARRESLMSVVALADAATLLLSSTEFLFRDHQNGMERGLLTLCFLVMRTMLFVIALSEQPLVEASVSGLWPVVLFFSTVHELSGSLSWISNTCFIFMATIALYCAMAELANSVAQKMVLATGPSKLWTLESPRKLDETGSLDSTEQGLSQPDEKVETKESVPPMDDYKLPGDMKLLGSSVFQSPLYFMTAGLAAYSVVASCAMFAGSEVLWLQAVGLISLAMFASLFVATSRGQTSFGFYAFTYMLEGILLLSPIASDKSSLGSSSVVSGALLLAVTVLQICWTAISYTVFPFLSRITVLHVLALSLVALSTISESKRLLEVFSGLFFLSIHGLSFFALFVLLYERHSGWCRQFLIHQTETTEDSALCPTGFAHNRADFDRCIQILRSGGVCCIPTDTVYCLACAANCPDAIKRIYKIKNRPGEKPLSLWVGSIEGIKEVGPEGKGWGPRLFRFMEELWPGQVSLVVSRGAWLSRMGVGNAADLIGTPDSIALRVPNSTLTVALLLESGPLAITSANPSGMCDCTHHNKVDDKIASQIDYLLADGPSPTTIASSVVDVRKVEDGGDLFFYRVGCVPEQHLWIQLNKALEREFMPTLAYIEETKFKNILWPLLDATGELLHCESWQLFLLQDTIQEELTSHFAIPWTLAAQQLQRVVSVLQTGRTLFNSDDETVSETNEILAPVYVQGAICGAICFLNKASSRDGAIASFSAQDLNTVKHVAQKIGEACRSIDSSVLSSDWEHHISVAGFGNFSRDALRLDERSALTNTTARKQRPSDSDYIAGKSINISSLCPSECDLPEEYEI